MGTFLLGIVFLPKQTWAAQPTALVQSSSAINDGSGAILAQEFPSANNSGNLIVVVTSWGTHSATPSVTDSLGNSYVLATSGYSSGGDQSLAIYYSANIKPGTNTVTVNLGGNHQWRRLLIAEYSGVNSTSPVDAVASNQGSASTAANNVTSGGMTTAASNDLVVGAEENYSDQGTVSAGSSFNMRNSVSDYGVIETALEDRVLPSAGSTAATFTFAHADPYLAQAVAFRAATGVVDTTPPSVPTGLSASAASSTQINVSWSASTDNVGVSGYQVFRNGNQVATSTSTSYPDTGLTPSTTFSYTVTAFDAAGNVSGKSAGASATTLTNNPTPTPTPTPTHTPTPSPTPTPTQGSSPNYPIKVSADGTYLVDQNNQPFFIVGDDAWTLITQLSNADAATYLQERASQGFNTIWAGAVDNIYQSNAPRNFYGNTPFDGADFTNEDAAYWAHVDSVIQVAGDYGITVMLSPAFVGLNAGSGYLDSYESSSAAVIEAYGTFLGSRYKSFPNIIWVLGGDADPANSTAYSNLSALASSIKSADPGHLMTFEASRYTSGSPAPGGGYSSLDVWSGPPSWLNLNWDYNTAPTVLSGAASNYQRIPFLPPLMGEDWYELENSMTEFQLRQEGYEEILGGAYLGRLFGNNAIWTFNSPSEETGDPNWQSELESAGSLAQSHLGALFRSREHWKLVPDLGNTVLTAGFESGSSIALAARTNDGQTIIAYISVGQTVTINLTKIADASATAWWFDPQTASTTFIGTFATTSSQNFVPPDQNDWVLVIDAASANLPAPGSNVYSQ